MDNQPTPQAPQNPQSGGSKPIGPIVGVVIIVLLLILGGLYFWGEKLNQSLNESGLYEQTPSEEVSVDAQTESLGVQGTSDGLSDIEADLNNTNTADLSAGLEDAGL